MKIALLINELAGPGGGERQALSLARELTNTGHRVTVFTSFYDPTACFPDLGKGLDIRAVATLDGRSAEQGRNWLSRLREKVHRHFVEPGLLARLINERFDVLNPHSRPSHRAAVLVKQRWGTPIAWMFNDLATWEMQYYEDGDVPIWTQRLKPLGLRRQERSLVGRINVVAVLSHGVQAIFHREFGVYPRVVRSGLDKEFLSLAGEREAMRNRLGVRPESILLLLLGWLWPSRRVEDAVRATALLREGSRDVKLAVVGSSAQAPNYLWQLKSQAAQLAIADHIRFISRNVSEADAPNYILGYATGNDFTARDLQSRSTQWMLGKSLDGSAPVGPWLVTADLADGDNLKIECRVNGEVRQSSNTSDMVFNCKQLVSYISRYFTLKPGDIIFTGTPEGVIAGYPKDKQIWLKAGDKIVTSIEKLGDLTFTLT